MKYWILSALMFLLMRAGICADAQQGQAAPAPAAPAATAPPGPGWDLLQRSCVNCHDIYMIIGKRRTPGEWGDIVNRMADRGAEVTPEELQVIEEYLVANFSLASGDYAPGASHSR